MKTFKRIVFIISVYLELSMTDEFCYVYAYVRDLTARENGKWHQKILPGKTQGICKFCKNTGNCVCLGIH